MRHMINWWAVFCDVVVLAALFVFACIPAGLICGMLSLFHFVVPFWELALAVFAVNMVAITLLCKVEVGDDE